ncbi:MAG: right-handed parallel beta-helix repeat-containing protein [Opitutales bacterium]
MNRKTLVTLGAMSVASLIQAAPISVHVSNYGAVPNDGKDDTVAIRNAIKAIENNADGGTIQFSAGTYHCAPQTISEGTIFFLRKSNMTLKGAGRDATTLSMFVYGMRDPDQYFIERKDGKYRVQQVNNWNNDWEFSHRFHGFVFSPPAGQNRGELHNVVLRDMRITGNAEPIDNDRWWSKEERVKYWDISHKGISFGWGSVALYGVLIENIEIDHFRGEIIYKGGVAACEAVIRNCKVHGTPSSAISGPAGIIENCEIYDCYNAAIETYLTNRAEGSTQHLIIRNNSISCGKNYPSWSPRNGISIANDPNWDGQFTFGNSNVKYNSSASTIEIYNNVIERFAKFGVFTYGMSNAVVKDNTFRNFYGNAMALWAYGNNAWGLAPHFENNLIMRNTFEYNHAEGTPCIMMVSPWLRSGSCLFVRNEITGTGYPRYFLSLSGASPNVEEDNYTVMGNSGRVGYSAYGNHWGGNVSRPLESGNYFEVATPHLSKVRLDDNLPVADYHAPHSRIYTWEKGMTYGVSKNNNDFDMAVHVGSFPDGYILQLQLIDNPDVQPITLPVAWWNDLDEPIVLTNPNQHIFLIKQGDIFRLLGYYEDPD